MRKKEGLADYRYFPEPDLPEVVLSSAYVEAIRASLPELPEAKRRRYEQMGLGMQDVLFLANDVAVRSSPPWVPLCRCRGLGPLTFELLPLAFRWLISSTPRSIMAPT